MKSLLALIALFSVSAMLQGCVIAAVGTAAAIAVDEANENDGEFDPFEEAYDGDPSTAGPLDRD